MITFRTILILAAMAMAANQARAALPEVDMGQVPAAQLDKGWSDVQTDGDVKFRAATKGGQRTVKVQAWWDEKSLRPAEGEIFVVEVKYKDTARSPIIFYSHGWLERYGGPGEVHRFGGAGDGQWKTAAVPVGWDQLIRLPKDRAHTGFGISATEDLPVATLKLRMAGNVSSSGRPVLSDEARYNAETRAWVAQVQAPLAEKTPLKVEPLKAEISRLRGGAALAFAWPVMLPLPPNGQPKAEQIGQPVKVRMCLNEMEGASFGVYAMGVDLKGVDYAISELKGEQGALAAEVVRRTAEYCLVQGGRDRHSWFPQRLWPAFAVDVPAGRSQWFVANLRTERGRAKPGLYKGEITLTAEGKPVGSLPLEVEVLPIDLLTMDEAGLLMGGCVTGLTPIHDTAFQVAYNQNASNMWYSGVQPDLSLKDGKLVIDWTYLDEWMAGAKKRGLKSVVWFLGGNPYAFPNTMTLQRELYRLKTGKADFLKVQGAEGARDKMLPEVRPLYVEFMRQLDEHRQAAGWPEIIVTPFDEPAKWIQEPGRKDGSTNPDIIGTGPWIKTYFKDSCAAIHEGSKLPIYGSIHHNRTPQEEGICFLPDIEVFCTNAIHEDPKLGDKVRAAKKRFWQYSGGGSAGDPANARYTYGVFFASYDSRGSLAWAYNWGAGYDTTKGENWMYAWQTPFDTTPAPYFEGVREAWDDRRIIETYKKTFAQDAEALADLNKMLKEAAASRAGGGRDTVSDFWAAIDDVGKLDKYRQTLLDRLVKAKKP